MGSTTIIEALRKAKDDKNVKAIVLRIDSPGGSALASDLIWHETQVLKKPMVASMGDVAASGGYYIAMGADKIFATPGTITGSIGVVGGKMAVHGLYDKVGIYDRNDRARQKQRPVFLERASSPTRSAKSSRACMEDMYDQFTEKAAKGRHMPVEKLRDAGWRPRVHRSSGAKRTGSSIELGTLDDAIERSEETGRDRQGCEVRPSKCCRSRRTSSSRSSAIMDAEKETQLGPALGKLGRVAGLAQFDFARNWRACCERRIGCGRFSIGRRRW